MRFSVYQESRKGGRRINQDRMGYCFTRDALLMVLADGLGGHAFGEVAAQHALQIIARQFQAQARPTIRRPADFLHDSILQAHHEIHRYARKHALPDVPRTTIVCCLLQDNHVQWAHAGDSRLYFIRQGHLVTRTRDHSKIENLVQQQRISAAEAALHPERNKLYNCLGSPNLPLVDVSETHALNVGDVVLLCSDGLWGSVSEDELVQQLSTHSVVQAIPTLITQALHNAGETADNTTAIGMMWEDDPHAHRDTQQGKSQALHGFTTSIMSEEGDGDEMSEEDIERSIAEIRAAIVKGGHFSR